MREVGWWMGSGRFGLRCGVCEERVCGHLYKQIDARDKHRQVGVDEEEHEELAIVEADRVDHPWAKVVHVQRQPLCDGVKVRARRLWMAHRHTGEGETRGVTTQDATRAGERAVARRDANRTVQPRSAAYRDTIAARCRIRHFPLPRLGWRARICAARVKPREKHEDEGKVEKDDANYSPGIHAMAQREDDNRNPVERHQQNYDERRGRSAASSTVARCAAPWCCLIGDFDC